MRRVAIFGCPGSGKTTLARALGPRFRLPVFHLDREYWLPGWTKPNWNQWVKKHDTLVSGEEWLIEGGYLLHGKERIQRSDLVIFLDLPLAVCLIRVLKRSVMNFGRQRAVEPEGCPGRLHLPLMIQTLKFKRKHQKLAALIREHLPRTGRMVTIRTNSDMERLLAEFA